MSSSRLFYLALFLTSTMLLGYGYYLQFVDGLEPCPLCIFQRIAYFAVITIAFIGLLHGPKVIWLKIYDSLIALSAITGGAIAARQVWLQHLPPDKVPECGPGLDFMLEVFPLPETLKMVLSGSGECAEVDWTFLTLSIAEWSLLCFSVFTIAVLIHLWKQTRISRNLR